MRASRDWTQRVVGVLSAAHAASLDGNAARDAARALKRCWEFLARDRVPVPTAFNVDVAFVFYEDELTWLRLFDELLADLAKLATVEPFDPQLLLGLAMEGWWQTAERQRDTPSWPHLCNERTARSTRGKWMAAWDAAAVGLLSPAQLAKWPNSPPLWRELEHPYRLWSATPLVVRAHGLLMAEVGFFPGQRGTSLREQRAYAC